MTLANSALGGRPDTGRPEPEPERLLITGKLRLRGDLMLAVALPAALRLLRGRA